MNDLKQSIVAVLKGMLIAAVFLIALPPMAYVIHFWWRYWE